MALFFAGFGPWRLVRNIAPTRELEAFGSSLRVYDLLCGPFPGGSLMTSGGLVPSSVLAPEDLPEFRREVGLARDLASEGDFVLEAAGPFDRLPFQALEGEAPFLWVYAELFTRLGVRFPLSDFQREVLTRCQVAVSQLHLNGWGFLRTFERVCLHFGFRPSWRIFLFTYHLHAPPPGNGFMSFRAYQGKRLFDAFEESIQEFKWHYFKVLPRPGTRPFWIDDEGRPYSWVYWNPEARECRVMALDPLETLAFDFLQSLPVGLGKRSNFRCRWILDHSDAEVGAFLGMPLVDVLLLSIFVGCVYCTLVERASASSQAASVPAPAVPVVPNPPPTATDKGRSSKDPVGKPFPVQGEEGVKEDPSADLRRKGRKRKAPGTAAEEAALGADAAWVHGVSPVERAFPESYNFRGALDAGLTNNATREILGPLVPEQLLGTAQHLACQLTACLQIGIEKTFASKVQLEKEVASLKDQVAAELESCHTALLKEKREAEGLAKSLGDRQVALDSAEAAAAYWQGEWKSLAEETGEMVQETFDILMDQVRHLHPAIDFSMITLDTRWDPKARRIYNPKAEAQGQAGPEAEKRPGPEVDVQAAEDIQEVLPEA
ncbi:hypothetical protein PIB30_038873 [Stylosanthes scabra]|uniref:Transposase (Putative), gypsy type n=1 Tax=Stylosanthes scabra TaxID=79078 RepID=A0ABU6XC81_9FABA|nr:hypothetical protein [Stylosanthes scabra]